MDNISARIKQIRKDEGLTQTAFGKMIGVHRDTIANIEGNRMPAKDIHIIAISKAFHISEEWIRTGSGEKELPMTKSMIAAEIADKYIKENSALKNAILREVTSMDENLLRLMISEARKIINAIDEAEKDQE